MAEIKLTFSGKLSCGECEDVFMWLHNPLKLASNIGVTDPDLQDQLVPGTIIDVTMINCASWQYTIQYDENLLVYPTSLLNECDIKQLCCAGCTEQFVIEEVRNTLGLNPEFGSEDELVLGVNQELISGVPFNSSPVCVTINAPASRNLYVDIRLVQHVLMEVQNIPPSITDAVDWIITAEPQFANAIGGPYALPTQPHTTDFLRATFEGAGSSDIDYALHRHMKTEAIHREIITAGNSLTLCGRSEIDGNGSTGYVFIRNTRSTLYYQTFEL